MAWPFECDRCPDEEKEYFGCGFVQLDGQAEAPYQHGATDDHWSRTCPRYCLALEPVMRVMGDLKDYQRGALGNVLDLPAPYLAALRAAESEMAAWQSEQDNQQAEAIDGG